MTSEIDHIIKKGVLQRFSTREKRWVKKFYVLFEKSERNAARLDWYDDERTFKTNPSVRKTLFMEAISRVERPPPSSDDTKAGDKETKLMNYTLEIYTHRSSVTMLRASNESTTVDWQKAINCLLEITRSQSLKCRTMIVESKPSSGFIYQPNLASSVTFDVEVDDTTASNVCSVYGQHQLVLSPQHITLVDHRVNKPVLNWQYEHVRRYGFSGETFTLEAGHKAGPGSGLFIFKNCPGSDIRQAMEQKMRSLQQQKKMQQQQQEEGDSYAYIELDVSGRSPAGSVSSSSSSSSANNDMSPTSPTKLLPIGSSTGAALQSKTSSLKSVSSDGGGSRKPAATKPVPATRPLKTSNSIDGGCKVSTGGSPQATNASNQRLPSQSVLTTEATTTATPTARGGDGGGKPQPPPKMSQVISQLHAAQSKLRSKTISPTDDGDDDMLNGAADESAGGYMTIDLVKEAAARTSTLTRVGGCGAGGGVGGGLPLQPPSAVGGRQQLDNGSGTGHLYGQLLLKHIKISDEESAYAEIKQF